MAALYKDARLKVDRAKKHIADFTAAMIALENACTVTVEQDEEGRDCLTHEIPNSRQALDNLSLIAGDAIHNLRSALDFAWVSTITRLLPDNSPTILSSLFGRKGTKSRVPFTGLR